MAAMKDLGLEVAYDYQKKHPNKAIEECFKIICEENEIEKYMKERGMI